MEVLEVDEEDDDDDDDELDEVTPSSGQKSLLFSEITLLLIGKQSYPTRKLGHVTHIKIV